MTKGWGGRPGTYLLHFRIEEPRHVSMGRIGEHILTPGLHVYVGSAFGPGGLDARLRHHLRREKRAHWHIDYLTAKVPVAGVTAVPWARLESRWAERLCHHPTASMPIPGFGAGDAKPGECKTHLFAFPPEMTRKKLEHWLLDDPWLRPLRDALGDDEVAETVAQSLARKYGEALSQPLLHWLHAGDSDQRWWAARTLALTDGSGAVGALVDTATKGDVDIRCAAILALGQIRAPEAVPALLQMLGNEDGMVSATAADALAQMGNVALTGLASAMTNGNEKAKVRAAYILRRLLPRDSDAAVLALYKALDDENYLVSSLAEEALMEMGYLENSLFVP